MMGGGGWSYVRAKVEVDLPGSLLPGPPILLPKAKVLGAEGAEKI